MKLCGFLVFLGFTGCGTEMVVKECRRELRVPEGTIMSDRDDSDGVVVNQRATYRCKVTLDLPNYIPASKDVDRIVGIDSQKVLAVNISRMIFASGKLVLKLDDKEVIKEAGVTSQTGAVGAVKATDTTLQKRLELKKARKDKEEEP
jgi:hypothetical protein